jgi:acetolactate synthase I/II/III large subunit
MAIGGHVVTEALEDLGAQHVFGLPGFHILGLWEGLRSSSLSYVGFRTELAAAFAASGYARATGRPAPLLISTGPGALISLAGMMEAASSHDPVVGIYSQIPDDAIGKGRGFPHELRDQAASFAPIVKWLGAAHSAEQIPAVLQEAFAQALRPPSGPVYVEIPVDVLEAETTVTATGVGPVEAERQVPPPGRLNEAARLLDAASRPVIWAGGGVGRSGAATELRALAEALQAPVVMSFMGKGAITDEHPLAVGSFCEDQPFVDLVTNADVVLAVGTELGAEATRDHSIEFAELIQIDAAPERIGATFPALGLVGDAKATLAELLVRVTQRRRDQQVEGLVARIRDEVSANHQERGHELEPRLLETIEAALPTDAVNVFDMTILGYWAASYYRSTSPRRWLYPLGSGTLGYAWAAALGAKVGVPDAVSFAVMGDGGSLYALQELASARQQDIAAKLLVIDDGGYGVLRGYQQESYGGTHGVDLVQPDFKQLAEAFGVPARRTSPDRLGVDIEWSLEVDGPALLTMPAMLDMYEPISADTVGSEA